MALLPPKAERLEGPFMDYIELRSFDNYIEANIVLNMLQHQNINCHLKDEHIVTIDPLLSPAIGGMKLMVHHSQVERAWNMMEKAERDYLRTIPCPVCKAHALEIVSITKKTFLQAGRIRQYDPERPFGGGYQNVPMHQVRVRF